MEIFDRQVLQNVIGDPLVLVGFFLISTVLGLLIAYIYRVTHRGFSYSQSFSVSLILITVITTLIIVLVEDSIARAIGIFGAFSIIRFRTAVKDVRDVSFIFFSLAIGLAVGVGSIATAVLGTVFISGLIYILYRINFGGLRKLEYVLNFKFVSKHHSDDQLKQMMNKYLKKHLLLNVDAKDKAGVLNFTYNVTLKKDNELNDFIEEMKKLNGLSEMNIIASKNDIEY